MQLTRTDASTDCTKVQTLLWENLAHMEPHLGHPARVSNSTPEDLAAKTACCPVSLVRNPDTGLTTNLVPATRIATGCR